MKAIIRKPSKTNMQSGLKKTNYWIIDFEFDHTIDKDQLMGWNSSFNTFHQLKLKFSSVEKAKQWCEQKSIQFVVEEEKSKISEPKSYASNFDKNRRRSWTH